MGRLPKDPGKLSRRRDARRGPEWVYLPPAGPLVVPELPRDVSAETRRWWKTWVDSPQAAAAFTSQTDWERLSMTAHLVEKYHEEPSGRLLRAINAGVSRLSVPGVDYAREGNANTEPVVAVSDPPSLPDRRSDAPNVSDHAEESAHPLFVSALSGSGAPPLRGAEAFSEETRRWYRVWAESAQGRVFVDLDWCRLQMLALLVERFFADPTPPVFIEIIRYEQGFGATPHDRQRMRWKIELPKRKPDSRDDDPEPSRRRIVDPRLPVAEGDDAPGASRWRK